MDRHITLPLSEAEARTLRAGDYVYLTGVLYTARDAAHKRMYDALKAGEELPVDLRGQLVYYLAKEVKRLGDEEFSKELESDIASFLNSNS